ncbi:hypothetical protein [Desulfurococcus amylolyticus]|uniref:Uncharacterized protein n=1 Tax=Desulfurococcus amylolyticus DSM 16532 TaxID=768672 RepID=I3XSI9_DESAM|nr:hypothetical protein [Desulfurococcus amylolyticus]AFL66913.1 hypothetical protein Desfe_1039 [Desulfurococcus amylolyticus DSM 16532]
MLRFERGSDPKRVRELVKEVLGEVGKAFKQGEYEGIKLRSNKDKN